jgi:ribosomal protein S18 acetylase RimI-like enzyme
VTLELEIEQPVSQASYQVLTDAMVEYQTELYGEAHYTTVGFFLRDANGGMQAGLSGRFRWGWLYIEMLWVASHLRGQGYGSRLLLEAETFVRSQGGVAVQLESGGTRALPFYARHGYEIVGSMAGYPRGSSQHFLRKWLASPPLEERR